MLDIQELDILNKIKNEGLHNSEFCEFNIYSHLLERDVRVYLSLDQSLDLGLSPRQWRLIKDFLSLPPSALEDVRQALFEHWDNGSDYWDVDLDLKESKDAFSLSDISGLFIMRETHKWGNSCQIRFIVPWDREHGAGAFIKDGKICGFGDL